LRALPKNVPRTGAARTGPARSGAGLGQPYRRPNTRDRVLQVAQALFAERGYRGTSLRDISARIGIKAPSLLHHFASKDELYLAVLDRIFTRLEAAAGSIGTGPESHRERIRRGVENAIDFIALRPHFDRIMWSEFIDEKAVGRQMLKRRVPPLFKLLVDFIREGQAQGEFRPEVDPFHFLMSLISVTIGYFTTAAMVRRIWNTDLLDARTIERRKREVNDLVARTLFKV
jgi:TetR/AcrR family transcriptional regulator